MASARGATHYSRIAERGRIIRAVADEAPTRTNLCDFPPATLEAWREQAQRDLQGAPLERLISRTPEGVAVRPLYTPDDAGPPAPREALLATPRRAWTICQEYAQADPRAAGAAAAEDLARGGEAAWFELDEALTSGLPGVEGRAGVAVGGAEDLAALLAGVDLATTPVVLSAGARVLPVAALLAAEAERRGVPAGRLHGGVLADPLALLAALGSLGWPIEHVYTDLAEVTRWTRAAAPGLRAVLVDGSTWHDAGASAADELALALATGVEHLRRLTALGLSVDAVAEATQFALSVGRDLFLELAKLRAARGLWARVVAACGGGPAAQVMRLHARASRREQSALDPWVNLLRGTAEGLAAAVGGADTIAVAAMDLPLGEPGELGRRLARNTQLLLREESHLGQVRDAAGGSWYVESLTDALARAAWSRLQQIEAEGGLLASLRAGAVQGRLAAAAAEQAKAAATLRLPVVGASRFAAPEERPTGAKVADRAEAVRKARSLGLWPHEHDSQTLSDVRAALAGGAGLVGFTRPGVGEPVQALARGRLSAPFEALRARADAWTARHGSPPRVALVPVGAQSRARVEYVRAYLPVGGFAALELPASEDPEEAARRFADTGAALAVICGADASYPDAVPALAPKLRAAGARAVVLAGRPKDQVDALRAAGVDLFIAAGADALATLEALQRRLEEAT